MTSLAVTAGNTRSPLRERKDDLYETPREAVRALLEAEPLPLHVWEPACGPGAIVRELETAGHNVLATDLVDYGWGHTAGADFLMEAPPPAPFDCIVTNPPYKLAGEFAAHGLRLCSKVVLLLRLNFLESEGRRAVLESGHLARVHVFRNRLPMMRRAGWEGPKASSTQAHAWFVWERSHSGPTELRRISWAPLAC